MTERLDPHEIYADYLEPAPVVRPERIALFKLDRILREAEELGDYLSRTSELTDTGDAIRALRHLRKQLEGSSQ